MVVFPFNACVRKELTYRVMSVRHVFTAMPLSNIACRVAMTQFATNAYLRFTLM